ncbi:MAG: hypothetical protein EOP83_14330 [Verrucomicrobiaceae bacterium]|nr:MAG: hypothetical protein EOP83_14330 [Verrucomicrobiaceae bacterium]
MFPDWLKEFTTSYRALIDMGASGEDRRALMVETQRANNIDGNELLEMFMAYIETPEGKRADPWRLTHA